MSKQPTIARITVYPIKSLDGHELQSSQVLSCGALVGDRQFALVDSWSKFVNGKTSPEIHNIRSTFTDDLQEVELSCGQERKNFSLETEQEQIGQWCSEYVGKKCRLIENRDGGFPDDSDAPGPTLVSTATLEAVSTWYEGVDLAEIRRRFRFNLEVADTPPFWEDGLVPPEHAVRRFHTGDIVWQGYGVCRRCVVPTRDSLDGSTTAGFARQFTDRREQELPDWAPRDRFDTFYRLGVNMRIESDADAAVIRIGDPVSIADHP